MDDVWGGVYSATGGWSPSQTTVDIAAGFGDGVSSVLSLGLYNTADFRNDLGIDGGVNECSASYEYSKYAGYAWGAGTIWAGGLSGGSNSVFWAGRGSLTTARTLGTTIDKTVIGGILNGLNINNRLVWGAASATFALNAKHGAKAVIRHVSPKSIWRLERAILKLRGITPKPF